MGDLRHQSLVGIYSSSLRSLRIKQNSKTFDGHWNCKGQKYGDLVFILGPGVAQSVEHPTLDLNSDFDLRVVSSSPS